MNEFLTILFGVLGTALTALATWGVQRLTAWLNTKIKSERGRELLATAIEIVATVVKQMYQTYVEEIKGTEKWTAEAQKKAFNAALEKAQMFMSTEVKDYITEKFGSVTEWIAIEIESNIYDLKHEHDESCIEVCDSAA